MKKWMLVTVMLAASPLLTTVPPSSAVEAASSAADPRPTALLDRIALGDPTIEKAHGVEVRQSEIRIGEANVPMRVLLPGGGEPWEGGTISLAMKVDPSAQNYVTARFWGGESNENYLFLFCEGKQIGYRHLGDVDVLAASDDKPPCDGQFLYTTNPLPLALTRGKHLVKLQVRVTGNIWGYGNNFNQYQKPMTKPSRGLYALYTHTDGCFVPPADDAQGRLPVGVCRETPGAEVLAAAKSRVSDAVNALLRSTKPINQMQAQFLAKAYLVQWTPAFHNPKALDQVVACLDDRYAAWKQNPDAVWQDKATWNPGWFGVGPAADAVRLLAAPLTPMLADKLPDGKTRRAAYSALFQDSRDWLRHNRRWLTNQALFTDVNLYLCDRCVAAIDPEKALPNAKALDYVYQSIGLRPWLGSDTDSGPDKRFGANFLQFTAKGLTRERGYVGGYGEVGIGGLMDAYDATRVPGGEGDPAVKAQLAKAYRARSPFRYPGLDEDGFKTMRLEQAIGWRDSGISGYTVYAQRGNGEHSALSVVAATRDPVLIGSAQQMMADNQFFAAVARTLADKSFRNTVGLLELPDEYAAVVSLPASPYRLPMTAGQPDFAFADEEDGVVAIKHQGTILYASLYWRSGFGINFFARTHYMTDRYQQTAVVREDIQFTPSGQTYTRPDWINFGFGNGGTHIKYPADIHQAAAGEILPIARGPADVSFKPGDESYWAGKGDFYALRYGPYLIGMNCTNDKTFDLKMPPGVTDADELITAKRTTFNGSVNVRPKSTVIFYISN